MAPNENDRKPGGTAQREAERRAIREARLAEALRANLKRRKAQTRGRETTTGDGGSPESDPGPSDG